MQRFLATAALTAIAAAPASASVIYSGPLSEIVYDTGNSEDFGTITIGEYSWDFGFVLGGPLDFAFVTSNVEHTGVFVNAAESLNARNFGQGDNIGVATPWLDMYNTSGANFNYEMHDFVDGTGTFAADGSIGYVGFAFGTVGDRRYGWMEFKINGGETRSMELLGYAYQSEAGTGIEAGVVPGPGGLAILGLTGLAARRRRRG